MSPLAEPIYTAEEYLRLERVANHKSEFVNGRVYAMAGASSAHGAIIWNLARDIGAQIRGKPCRAWVTEMRVKVRPTGLYTYPDLAALRGAPPQYEDGHTDTLLNPTTIVEVLSESTEKYDRTAKFAHYQHLESLREYILIAQDQPHVERYVRDGEAWRLFMIVGVDASFTIETLGCTLALRDIYDGVDFSPPDAREPVLRSR